ncbi:hypothetical protein Tco_0589345 [Tanacetum coccineum]
MTTLQFADTHNMVVFLSKLAECEGFEQIVDFLNANPIRYALIVNPTIYTSCIEQFWATIKVKTVNGEVQLQALVDGKKIIITESTVRRDLQLEDAEEVDCLPNTIFEQLTLMGAKTTAWNGFSSTMASAIICLATNQKLNFSKYIFESMVKNLDNAGKFLMYPRFVQVFLNKQLEGMENHNGIYIAPSHTKKIFGNMRMVRKGFSGRETPLFPTMMVQAQQEKGEGSANPTDPHHTPTIIQSSSSQPQKKHKPRRSKKKDTQVPQSSVPSDYVVDEAVYKERDDSLVRAATTASSLETEQDSGNSNKTQSKATPNEPGSQGTGSGGGPRCQETMGDIIAQTRFENVSKTSNDSLLAGVNTPRSDEDTQEITSLKLRVKKLEKKGGSRTYKLKILYKIGFKAGVVSSDEESLGEADASKLGRKIDDIDADEGITLVDETAKNQGRFNDEIMFDVSDLAGEEVFVAEKRVPDSKKDDVVSSAGVATTVSAAATKVTITPEEITLAQELHELKTAKPKAKGIVFREPGESTTTTPTPIPLKIQDKGKGIMEEPEKPTKRKDQIRHDEEVAQRLQAQMQAELEEKERLAREKEEEANIVSWDNVQAMIDVDYQMALQLQAQKQEELTIEEKS